jgi:hypothetical protein
LFTSISNFLVANCNFTINFFFPMWFQTVMLTRFAVSFLPCVSLRPALQCRNRGVAYRSKQRLHVTRFIVCWVDDPPHRKIPNAEHYSGRTPIRWHTTHFVYERGFRTNSNLVQYCEL